MHEKTGPGSGLSLFSRKRVEFKELCNCIFVCRIMPKAAYPPAVFSGRV